MPSIDMNANKANEEDFEDEYTEPEVDYEEIRRRRERSDLVSKKLGELLLRGYRMLDEICDACGCILMQLRSEPKVCVQCNDQPAPQQTRVIPVAVAAASSLIIDEEEPMPPANEVKRQKVDDNEISKKLSDLLLKGFKMLNATCEKCDCILMQKRNENPFCVACEDTDKAKVQQQQKQPVSSTQISTLSTNAIEVKQTLKRKIQWATGELQKVSTTVNQSIELCDLIKAATNALAAVEQLKEF